MALSTKMTLLDIFYSFTSLQYNFQMEKPSTNITIAQFQQDPVLQLRYHLVQDISSDEFVHVFKAVLKRNGATITLKTQSKSKSRAASPLAHEFHMLTRLQGSPGVPKVYEFGEWSGGSFLQLEYLPEGLEGKTFSLSEMGDLALQMLRILQGLHIAKVLHQDLQPNSFMRSEAGQLFLVDFGKAKSIPIRKHPQEVHPFHGNYRFASVRAHNSQELTKKDDLESLFYIMACLYYHKLPWSRLSPQMDHKLAKIKQLKISSRDTLFVEMGASFMRAYDYVLQLESYGQPDYAQLKGYFKRRKTVVFEKKVEERSKPKKFSLTFSLLAQLPEQVSNEESGISFTFGKIGDGAGGKKTNQSSNQCSLAFRAEEDFECDDSFESIVSKPVRTIALKNPFAN